MPTITHKLLSGVVITLALISLLTLSTHALFAPLDFDEGYNLQVSSHLATVGTYASYDGIHDPKITTGWPVLAAAALTVSPSHPLYARIPAVLYTITLIIMVCVGILRTAAKRMLFLLATFAIPLFYLMGTSVLGEMPALTLAVAGLIFYRKRRFLLAGITLGLAMQTKPTFALMGAAIGIDVLYTLFHTRTRKQFLSQTQHAILVLIVGVALPLVGWMLYQIYTLGGWQQYLVQLLQNSDWARSQTTPRPDLIGERLYMLQMILHIESVVFLLIVGIALIRSYQTSSSLEIRVLSLFTYIWTSYVLILGATGWYRHLFPAIVTLSIVLASYAEQLPRVLSRLRKSPFLILLLLLPSITSVQTYLFNNSLDRFAYLTTSQNLLFLDYSNRPYRRPKQILQHQRDAAHFIQNTISPNDSIAGLGWFNTPQIAYLTNRPIGRDAAHADYVIIDIYTRYLNKNGVNTYLVSHPNLIKMYENPSYTIYKTSHASSCKIQAVPK